jgi:hypothetical protein
MLKNTPLDLKLVSIFLFCSAFSFLEVNTNYNFILGITVTGNFAKIIWALSSIISAIGAFGLWTRNLKIMKILIVYFTFMLANYILWFVFIPMEDKVKIIRPEKISQYFNSTTVTIFFVGFTTFQILFIIYLHKRKLIFK